MTNKPREIEVQVHCSMTTTDSIYLIKETSICNYVMIIHSPHLCGLPGFKADHSDVEIAKVRCREVISDADFDRWINGEAVDMPFLTIGRQGYLQEQEEQKEEESQPAVGELGQKQKGWETVQLEEGMTVDEMKDVLAQLLGSSAGGGGDEDMEGEEELMLITLDDEGEEPVVLRADFLAGQREAQGGMDRETIVKFVKEYLKQKEKPKRSEDEQDKKNKAARAKEEL
jgi:protein OS-9